MHQVLFGLLTAITIPVSIHMGNIFVAATVNGSRPLQFQLDTAAGVHALNWSVYEELGLATLAASTAEGAGNGSTRAAVLRDVTLSINGVALPVARTAAIALDAVADQKGYRLDGLIGADLMRHWVVEVDYAAAVLRLYEPSTWRYEGSGDCLPLRVEDTGEMYVTVPVEIPGGSIVSAEFKIDSAAGETTAMFTSPFAQKHELLRAAHHANVRVLKEEIIGVGGTAVSWTTRLVAIRVGRTRLRNPVVHVSGATAGTLARSDIAGIIGGGLLGRFRVIYDWPQHRLYVEPATAVKDPFEADMSGIRWIASGPDRKHFRVRSVLPDSAAADAGIAPGDALLAVEGRTAGTFDREWLQHTLREHGRTVRLTLERRGVVRETLLVLRRLL